MEGWMEDDGANEKHLLTNENQSILLLYNLTSFPHISYTSIPSNMVQMTAKDQVVVKNLPGNNQCCDCGMKNPDWASVSFGNVFCLECSGVHR